ncbi:hypothetical protein DH2020_015549 [Rehmannia glutinosa]|uniref:Uncharacterized protein n=1 Tax=Rehmannia glutinosa TaxID=99300 RepID=A0ABR0WSZ3_REHGL
MAPMYGLIQADYIYDLEWAEKADKIFVEMLLGEHAAGNWSPYGNNEIAITIAMKEWDDFSLAYQYYGDSEWPALYQLFNTDDAPYKFNNIDVVDVSSDEGDEKEVIKIVDDSLSNDKTDGGKLPKTSPIREPSKVRCGSFNRLDRDLYHLLEQYPYSDSGSSEPSVNQPLPQSSSKNCLSSPWPRTLLDVHAFLACPLHHRPKVLKPLVLLAQDQFERLRS